MIDAIKRVDGGCSSCVDGLCHRLSRLDLGWEWRLKECDPTTNEDGLDFEMDGDGFPSVVVTEKPKSNEGK